MKKIFSILGSTILAFGWLLLAPVPVAHAANTCEWNGSVDANWNTAGNWSTCGGVAPVAGDDLLFPVSASNKLMNNDQGAIIYQTVTIVGDNYTFAGNTVTVSNSWQLSGDNNTISVDAGITNASSSSFIVNAGATGNILDGDLILNLTAGGDMNSMVNEDFVHNGAITGSVDGFQQTGTNTWSTSTANASTFTASFVSVASGNVLCRNNNCLGAVANPVRILSGAQLQFDNLTFSNPLTMNFNNGANSVNLRGMDGAGISLNGGIDMNGPAQIQLGSGTNFQILGANDFSDTVEVSGNTATTSTFRNTSTITGSGELSCSNVACEMETNIAGYDGVIRGKAGSIIRPELGNALGSTVGNTIIESGASLEVLDGADMTIPENISTQGVGVSSSGAIRNEDTAGTRTFSGIITLTGDTTFFNQDINGVGPSADMVFSGVIGGTGNLTLTDSGLTAYIWFDGSSANTYLGTTYINQAQLVLVKDPSVVAIPGDVEINASTGIAQLQDNGGEQMSNTANVVLVEGGAFNAEWQVGDTETVGSIAGDGDIYIVGGEVLHAGNNDSSTTYAGKITTFPDMGGTFNKVGAGTLTLTGTPTVGFVPVYTVSGGTLSVMNNFTDAPFTINSGGTLKGTGTTGATTINTGGTINAGTSPGCITASPLTLSAGSTFEEEIAGGTACTEYDRTNVIGNATLGGANLSVLPSYTPTPGTTYVILETTNGNVLGTFNGLVDGATFTANGVQFRINYTSNQVILTALGGSLVPTGQNHNGVAYIAALLTAFGAAGLYFTLRRKKLAIIRTAL